MQSSNDMDDYTDNETKDHSSSLSDSYTNAFNSIYIGFQAHHIAIANPFN